MELSLVNCNFLKKIKSVSWCQIVFPINTPKIQIHTSVIALCTIGFGAEGAPHWTAPMDTSVLLFWLFPLLPCFLLAYFPGSHLLPVVGKFRWALFAESWGFIHLKFTCFFLHREGGFTAHALGAVTPIVYSGPTRHTSAFSHCTTTLKVSNALIQITKTLRLSLTEILHFVVFAFSTSVAATLHRHVIFAFNVLIKRKCKAYICLNHEINTHISAWHLKVRKYQNLVSPLSSVYGRNVWRWFKGYLQASLISIFKKLFIIWKGRYVMTNDVPQTSNTFLDNSKLEKKMIFHCNEC